MMMDAPDGTGSSSSIGSMVPTKHAMVANKEERRTKLPMRLVNNLAVAPGISSNAPTIPRQYLYRGDGDQGDHHDK